MSALISASEASIIAVNKIRIKHLSKEGNRRAKLISKIQDNFEDFFATPQSVDLAKLCEAHGFYYEQIQCWDDFVPSIEDLPESSLRILELRTDRKADVVMLSEILKI